MTQQFYSWIYIWKKNSKIYMHSNVHSSIIYNCCGMKTTHVSINSWVDKEDVVCTYGILRHKKEWNFACSKMDGLGGHYAKGNKSDKERRILYDIIYKWNLKNTTNWWIRQKRRWWADTENKLVVTSSGKREARRGRRGLGRGKGRVITGLYEIIYVKLFKIVK